MRSKKRSLLRGGLLACVLASLTTGVALKLGKELRPMLQDIKRNLRSKRYTTST